MEHDRLLADMKRTIAELQVFNEIGKALTSTLDIKEVLGVIMQKISDLLKPTHWSLLLMDDSGRFLEFEVAVGEGSEKLKNVKLPVDEGVVGWVAREGKPLLIKDAHQDERWCKDMDEVTDFQTRAIICAPLVSKDTVLGVIELVNEQPGAFSESDMRLLNSLADYAAIAIENARNYQQLQEITVTDDVTSLYNSRYLHETLAREFERAQRYSLPFSVIFFDLDHFKNVNDAHGHLCGSQLLTEIGELIKENIRTLDVPIRYGGDEFVIVLPQTGKEKAVHVARRLRLSLNEGVFLAEKDLALRVTASFGVANYPQDGSDKDSILRLADEAMYRVKESTRDGIEIAEPVEEAEEGVAPPQEPPSQ